MPRSRHLIHQLQLVALGSICVVALPLLGQVTTGDLVAFGSPPRTASATNSPPATPGQFVAVAVVPHSSDVWATGYSGVPPRDTMYVARRHGGHWTRMKPPKIGRFGYLGAVTATAAKSVWVGGARQHGNHDFPAIWRWKGGTFVAAKLPRLRGGGVTNNVQSMSASSATNAWAVGPLRLASGRGHIALHLDGTKWSAVTIPEAFVDVSVSSPTNAWAVGDAGDLFRWNGSAWTKDDPGYALEGNFVDAIATSSPNLAYAVGDNSSGAGGQVMRFNGTSWSDAPLTQKVRHLTLTSVAIHGRAAWAIGSGAAKQVVVHSSGGTWKIQQSLSRSHQLTAISAASTKHAAVVGSDDVGASNHTLFDAFNGHAWKIMPSKF